MAVELGGGRTYHFRLFDLIPAMLRVIALLLKGLPDVSIFFVGVATADSRFFRMWWITEISINRWKRREGADGINSSNHDHRSGHGWNDHGDHHL